MEDKKEKLENIPGVGKSIALDLRELGIHKVSDLKYRDPQRMYDDLCSIRNVNIDRCILYVFRCAVYYAENERHDPDLLKWWNWENSSY